MIRNGNTKIKRIYNGGRKIRRAYNGNRLIWSAGNNVIYNIDSPSGKVYTKEVEAGDNCLDSKYLDFEYKNIWQGWTFHGWRESLEASIQNLITQKIMGDDPISLYAVYSMPVSVTYNGNGNTGGSVSAQSGTRYYNNGNNLNPSFKLSAGGFSKTAYSLRQWSAGNPGSQTKYALGSTQAFASSQNLYADWAAVDGFKKDWGTLNSYGSGGDSGTTQNYQIDLTGFDRIECCCYMQQGAGAPKIQFKLDGAVKLEYTGDRGNNGSLGWRGKNPNSGEIYDSNYWIDVKSLTGNHNLSVTWSGDGMSSHQYVTMVFKTGTAKTIEFSVDGDQLTRAGEAKVKMMKLSLNTEETEEKTAVFTFADEWKNRKKAAVFANDGGEYAAPIIDGKCDIPKQVLGGSCTVYVVGEQNGHRIVTNGVEVV